MKRLTTVVVTAGLLAGGVLAAGQTAAGAAPAGGSAAAAGSDYTPPPIEWGTCASASMQAAGARCGLLTVPLDYAKPRGTKIKIGVSQIKHKTSNAGFQGIMLVNPGGPGGSGLNLARLGAFVPGGGGDPYDWIGFDPRGVGTSQPNLSCDGDYFGFARPDYVPFTAALERTWRAKAAGYAADCAAVGGRLLDHMKTTDWVADMESIRKAFHADQINYYGFSYGTYLGQVYATLHPDKVRRMVWDGVVNWKRVWYNANLDQDYAFDANLDRYFSWIAEHNSVYGLGDTRAKVHKLWYAMLAKSRQAPFDGKIGPDEWSDIFQGAAYYVYGWEPTAEMFVAAVAGDYGPAVAFYGGPGGPGSDNTYAVYNAVQCTDTQWPQNFGKWRRDNWATYAVAPFLTWGNAWYNAPCLTWAGQTDKKATPVKGKNVAPILMIEETFDAATPFGGALQARATFPKSVLIEGVRGTTHAGSLSGVECTDNRIADYLLTGTLDPRKSGDRSDVKCPPVPPADPQPSASRSTAPSGKAAVQDRLPADLRELLTSTR